MRISILTLFPNMFEGFLQTSIVKRGIESGAVSVDCVDIRQFTVDKHNKVDDYPYGGGAGLVLMCQPVVDAIKATQTEGSLVVMLTPQGKTLKQAIAYELSEISHLILVCGHYEGFDERIRDYVDLELSIGDYVLTGGEVAAMVVSDAVIRLVDGVIAKDSHEGDSFSHGLLEHAQYTRPREYDGKAVPEVVVSGHHENVRRFRLQSALEKTLKYRPDLLEGRDFTKEELKIMEEIKGSL